MFEELETVALTHDIKGHGLKEADVGAIVYVHSNGVGFEVEFVTAQGDTVAVLTDRVDPRLAIDHVPPVGRDTMVHGSAFSAQRRSFRKCNGKSS